MAKFYIDRSGVLPIILPLKNDNTYYEVIVRVGDTEQDRYQTLLAKYSKFGTPQCLIIHQNDHILSFEKHKDAVACYKNMVKRGNLNVRLEDQVHSSLNMKCHLLKPDRPWMENLRFLDYIVQAVIHDDHEAFTSAHIYCKDLDVPPPIVHVANLYLMETMKKQPLVDVLVADFPVYFTQKQINELIYAILPKSHFSDVKLYNFNETLRAPLFCIIYVESVTDGELIVRKLHNKTIDYKKLKAMLMSDLQSLLKPN